VALTKTGAKSVSVYVTHGVLSGNAAERIASAPIESMTITDSILPTEAVCRAANLRLFSTAPILAEAMQRISDESSVSSLFD
jgi:ribose-phosphate pyrophosphokinase